MIIFYNEFKRSLELSKENMVVDEIMHYLYNVDACDDINAVMKYMRQT